MIVQIKKTDSRFGLKVGQIYDADPYWLDPSSKVTLKRRLTKKDRKPIGKEPGCNVYRSEVEIIK